MGSVLDTIECPNCKHEAHSDYYYKSGEEYIVCQNCGYYKSLTIKNKNIPPSELIEEDWELIEISNPYGAYQIRHKEAIATQCGTLITEEDYHILCKHIEDLKKDVDFFMVSRLIDGEIVIEEIINNSKN